MKSFEWPKISTYLALNGTFYLNQPFGHADPWSGQAHLNPELMGSNP